MACIPDDGYRELKSKNATDMPDPAVHAIQRKPILSMIHKYNIAELSLVDRPIGGTKQGFGSTLPRHEHTHEQRYFATENRTFYG